MKISFSFLGPSLSQQADAMGRDLAKATTAAVAAAAGGAKEEMRRQLAGYVGAFGRGRMGRVQNAIRSEAFPRPPKYSLRAAGRVYARGEQAERIFSAFATGPYITPHKGRALAIPLHQHRDINGALLGPRSSYWGGRLTFIPSRKGGPSLGVLAQDRSGGRKSAVRKLRNSRNRKPFSDKIAGTLVPQFVLVRAVRHAKLLTPEATMQRWAAEVPRLIDEALVIMQRAA